MPDESDPGGTAAAVPHLSFQLFETDGPGAGGGDPHPQCPWLAVG
jgi:hypothetical protein